MTPAPEIARVSPWRRRRILFITAVLAVPVIALLLSFTLAGRAATSAPPETAMVVEGPLDITVDVKGQFQAVKTVDIYPDIRGGANITWLIPDGTIVKKGDLLAKLDTGRLDDQILSLQRQVDSSENDIAQSQEALKIAQNSAQADISAAESKVKFAELSLNQYGTVALRNDGSVDDDAYNGPNPPDKGDAYQQFRDAALEIQRADSALEQAKTDFQDMDVLLARGFVTKNDYDTKELNVTEAERKLESAKLAYEILLTYTYPQTLAEKKQGLTEAQNDLEKTRLRTSVDITTAKTDLSAAQLRRQNRKSRLADMQADFAARTITAPIDGQILYGDPAQPWWRDHITVGGQIWQGIRLFTIPDTTSIVAQGRLLEMDVDLVKVGQKARITFDALRGVTLTGSVSKVAEYASQDDRRGLTSAKGFDIQISLDPTDVVVKPGMTCQAEIISDSIPDALYVPVLSVFSKGAKKVCYLVDGENTTPVEVTTGRASDKFVEILSGLSAGQKVLVAETKPEEKKLAALGSTK